MAEKLRVHTLAKELGVTSKAILDKCNAEGLELKNHMAALTAGLAATIREWFSEGAHTTTIEHAGRVDVDEERKAARKARAARAKSAAAEAHAASDTAVAEPPSHDESPTHELGEERLEDAIVAPARTVEHEDEFTEVAAEDEIAPAEPPSVAAVAAPEPTPAPPEPIAAEAPVEQKKEAVKPAGPQNVPAPAQLQGPRVVRVEAPEHVSAPPRSVGPRRPAAAHRLEPEVEPAPEVGAVRGRRGPGGGPETAADDAKKRRGRQNPRRSRQDTEVVATERLREWREQDLLERQERMNTAAGRGLHSRRAREARTLAGQRAKPMVRTKAQVTQPIIMHEFCAATGIGMSQLVPTLIRDHNIMPNRNTVLDAELAVSLAGDHGIELEIVRPRSILETISDEFAARERPHLAPRPPVVTFLGHVDHGKTSLLDAIRSTRVAAGEAGGITQHIGAYRIDREGLSVTFLDTPGHEAFTAMRARGAHLTDVVVLVIAADDGVMPQTVEAMNHAKAAGVPIVVALNKTDLPGVDVNKVLGQLAEHHLVPTEWGGDVDVIRTSAKTGAGIDKLLEHLSTLSELIELKADPTLDACGSVVDAKLRVGVGAATTVLVQEGTLRTGDVVVCGPAFGRVRAMLNDRGDRIETALPATPVELVGLDEVPNAGDRFYVLDSLNRAKEAAEEVRDTRRLDSLFKLQKPRSLEEIFSSREEGETLELNLILRADVQGSVDVLTKTLGEIGTDEVRVKILQAAVGPITEGDVILAQASDAIIIGFHVVAETGAQKLAEEKGVDVRLYRVIYEISNDVTKALEGLLEPDKKEETSGRVEVREVFNVSKVGTIAGCYVVDGVVRRTDFVRLVRDGRIILPTEDDVARGRHRAIHSLKRFKDDAREVRAGLECGIKIEDYDDVKVGDMIESYAVIEVSRKLS